jgi:uroporphyrin-III C-methyltransferase
MNNTKINQNSKLTLVGAGPGDIELLTLKAVKALRLADVILYDALANEEILKFAKPNAILVNVGKRLGRYIFSQEDINQMILENAINHGHVVRLKGGDPFVFGRGHEEMEFIKSYGIECEVVSGVSSCIAAPASIGIPVTSRGVADSFWVITGTTKEGNLADDLIWAAHSSATIIILMGMSKLAEICELFQKNGRGNTPMAIIQNGTRETAKYAITTVENMVEISKEKAMANPAVIVIGEVVNLHQKKVEMLSFLTENQIHSFQ